MISPQDGSWCFRSSLRTAALALALVIMFVLTVGASQAARAQTFSVIHNFTGGGDGANPYAGLTIDRGGNLYGTAANGGNGSGTVFRLALKHSAWIFTPLYTFKGNPTGDGAVPVARVIFGPGGSLYGTTSNGGTAGCGGGGCGTVFNLKPSASACKTALCPWTETVLYRFAGYPNDGESPSFGDLAFDQAGYIYGTTQGGGALNRGTVYKLMASDGGSTESVLYDFTAVNDGALPLGGVVFDRAGNLYGTTFSGGGANNDGTVFELTPSGSGWLENVLYAFQGGSDGEYPIAGLSFDQSGNLYGTTSSGGADNGGAAFELSASGGSWNYMLVYGFTGMKGPVGSLIMDNAGSLFGTTAGDGAFGYGSAFKLTPSNGSWTYTSLHDFTGGSDGGSPDGSLVFDANGNLYGTTYAGGTGSACNSGCGVVFEITP